MAAEVKASECSDAHVQLHSFVAVPAGVKNDDDEKRRRFTQ